MSGVVTYDKCPLCGSEQIKPFLKVKDHAHTGEVFELYRCNGCYFVFTQNVPDEAHIGPYYKSENYVSHTDTRKGLFFKLYHIARGMMLRKKQKLIEQFVTKKPASLLDIGSATGYFLNHMKQQGYEVTGVETDEDARAFSEKEFGIKAHEPQSFFTWDTQKFDVITMWHVLEHVHDLHGYVQQMHDRLADDGVIAIAVPNHNSTDRRFFKEYWAAYDIPVHLWHFDPETITRLFNEHGLELVKKKSMPFDAFYISALSFQHQGKSMAFIRGLFYGIIPFLNQLLDTESSSSITYFFKKK